ncbi:hypothetical protein F5884DRAFT_903558 [Xylogone sp. PMI_703]|nr:hypothetical protein F5884DRAFT_903558 [Xylogone sp. PMI_703]
MASFVGRLLVLGIVSKLVSAAAITNNDSPLNPASPLNAPLFQNVTFPSQLLARADGCSSTNPCPEGCCSPFGFCGYGPSFCSSESGCIAAGSQNGTCNLKSECDPGNFPGWGEVWGPEYAMSESCPLNVCCSQFGFCGTTVDFCGSTTVAQPSCDGTSSTKRTIAYYEGWSVTRPCDQMPPSEIPIGAYTHLNYAFLSIDPSTFEIVPATPEEVALFPEFTALKQSKPGLECWLSIGGWAFNDPGPTMFTFSELVASSAAQSSAQSRFFSSLLSFMSQYGFDGVDIDWYRLPLIKEAESSKNSFSLLIARRTLTIIREYPVTPDRNGTTADFSNLVTFMQDLRATLKSANKGYGLSMTIPSSYFYMQDFDIVNLANSIDWFNVMTYDLHGTWDAIDPFIGNLMLAHTNLTEIKQTMDLLWLNNIDPEKVTMGYGFYGRSFTAQDPGCLEAGCPFIGGGNAGSCTQSSGTLSYTEIEAILNDPSNNAVITLDPVAAVQIVTWGGNQWVSFDNQETMEMKQAYANSRCIGGQMVWAASLDNGGIAAGFLSNSTNEFPQGTGQTGTVVNIPPTIWESPNPSVACLPPCTFVLPPVPLATPTVVTWPNVVTTLLSSVNGVIKTMTTTISISPFAVSSIPLWPVTVVETDTLEATFTPVQSVTPPAITVIVPGSIALPPVGNSECTTTVAQQQNNKRAQAVDTPSPIQTGMVSGCTQFYQVVSGDTCTGVVEKFGISISQFETWNPSVGSGCFFMLAGDYYCVAVGAGGIATAAPGGATTTSGCPVITQGATFASSSHFITIHPEPTISVSFSTLPPPVAYTTNTPPDPGPCTGVTGVVGCGTIACAIFGCGGGCGVAACGGGCGITFCGGGCGLGGCGPGCGEGLCLPPITGLPPGDDPDDPEDPICSIRPPPVISISASNIGHTSSSSSTISPTTTTTTTTTTTSSAPTPTLSSFFFIGLASEGTGSDQTFFSIAWPQNLNCDQVVSGSTDYSMTLIDTDGNTIQPVNFNTYIPGASGFTLRGACGFNEDITLTGSDPAFTGNVGSAHILCERENHASTGCDNDFATEPFFNCIVDGSNDFCFGQQG